MPRLLGYDIASDAQSMTDRSQSQKGYIHSDEGALTDLGILTRARGMLSVNHNINIGKVEIAELLNWFAATPKYPLPPAVRKILCLKRARLLASDSSVATSRSARTDQKKMIQRIDEMLKNDGMTDMTGATDPLRCPIEGSKFVAAKLPPITTPDTSKSGASCHTEVKCDTNGILIVLESIRAKIDELHSMGSQASALTPPAVSTTTTVPLLTNGTTGAVAVPLPSAPPANASAATGAVAVPLPSASTTTTGAVAVPLPSASTTTTGAVAVPLLSAPTEADVALGTLANSVRDGLISLKTLIETKTTEVLTQINEKSERNGVVVGQARDTILTQINDKSNIQETLIGQARDTIVDTIRRDPRLGLLQNRLEDISTVLNEKLDEIRAQPAEYERIVRGLVTTLQTDITLRFDNLHEDINSVKAVVREVCVPTNYDEALIAIREEIAQLRTDVVRTAVGTQSMFTMGITALYRTMQELRSFAEDAVNAAVPYANDIQIIREAVERLGDLTGVDALRQQIVQLEGQIQGRDDHIDNIEDQLLFAQTFMLKLESEKNHLKSCLAILTNANQQLRESSEAKETRIAELIHTIQQLHDELEASAAANRLALAFLRRRLEAAKAELVRKDAIIAELHAEIERLRGELAARTREYEERIAQMKRDNLEEFSALQNECGENINDAVEEERKKCIDSVRLKVAEHTRVIQQKDIAHREALAQKDRECAEALARKDRECAEATARKERECEERLARAPAQAAPAQAAPAPEPLAPEPLAPEPLAPVSLPLPMSRGKKQYGEFTTKQLERSIGDIVKLDTSLNPAQKRKTLDETHAFIDRLVQIYEDETPNISALSSVATSLIEKLPKLQSATQRNTGMIKLTDVNAENAKTFIEQLFNKLGNLTKAVTGTKRGGGKLNSTSYTRKRRR
jgi:hypothetical protein